MEDSKNILKGAVDLMLRFVADLEYKLSEKDATIKELTGHIYKLDNQIKELKEKYESK